ncbi:rod shape-determining protein MreC [Anaerolinea thermolimosa]|uniref:rod shape-determining protein MreC n=1 Tax=Anaerolinea thermolimosa TaxID=229919 RepID=UPI000A017AC0|nr:rod shape-determining protein MreC [Anaerolinea thermolimosa]GAP06817.1 rod shape-determining protein MreC [Anaerolinea thermolimosa]
MIFVLKKFWKAGVLVLLGAGLLALALGGYLTPVFSLASAPVIATQRWLSIRFTAIYQMLNSPQELAALRQQVDILQNENARLQSQVVELQQQLKDTELLYELLRFARSRPEDTYVAAAVIGRDPSPFLHYVIIDKGSDDGLRRGMPVVTAQGLVGRIDAVIANAARVQLINDAGSAVNVKLASGAIEAMLTGSLTGDISLEMVPQDVTLKPGDVILTSALGGIYPENILVGQVVSVRRMETELFQTASVQPAVNFATLRAVLVVTDFNPVDITPLIP